jgi:adenylosuccinate lyase
MLVENVARGLVVYPKVIARKLREQLPFLATEEILMAGVRAGGDRQELHERVRVHSRAAALAIKQDGRDNPLLELIGKDPMFARIRAELPSLLDPARFIGRCREQVDAFLASELEPRLAGVSDLSPGGEIRV